MLFFSIDLQSLRLTLKLPIETHNKRVLPIPFMMLRHSLLSQNQVVAAIRFC